MDGELERDGAGWRLRFTRRLDHPVDEVWSALTEPDRLAAWFPDSIRVARWEVGEPMRFGSPQVGEFDGEVRAVDPPKLLEFSWGTDLLRFELASEGGSTVLTLLDTIDEQGKAARDGAGWHVCLDNLAAVLAGEQARDAMQAWNEVHPAYVEKFGAEASTIGPPGA